MFQGKISVKNLSFDGKDKANINYYQNLAITSKKSSDKLTKREK